MVTTNNDLHYDPTPTSDPILTSHPHHGICNNYYWSYTIRMLEHMAKANLIDYKFSPIHYEIMTFHV
jgi:hypothetical protein